MTFVQTLVVPYGQSLLALLAFTAIAQAQPTGLRAPNVVEATPRLVTAGQPSADALAKLKAQGFGAVVYLAPPTVSDAVRDEPLIVARQGLAFVNLPIDFEHPTEADFEALSAVLKAFADRKVLVHCQINLRASSLVFLHRTITLKEDPRVAYDAVTAVWSPHGPWRTLIEAQLRKHAIAFDPL